MKSIEIDTMIWDRNTTCTIRSNQLDGGMWLISACNGQHGTGPQVMGSPKWDDLHNLWATLIWVRTELVMLKFGKGSHLRNGRITRDNSHLICGYAGQHSSTLSLVLSTSRTSSSGCSWWRTLAKCFSSRKPLASSSTPISTSKVDSNQPVCCKTTLRTRCVAWVACCTRQHPRNGLCLSCLGWFPRTSVQPPFFATVLCSIARASVADCGACGASAAAGRVSWVIEVPKTFSLTSHWPFFSSAFSWSFFMPFFLMA